MLRRRRLSGSLLSLNEFDFLQEKNQTVGPAQAFAGAAENVTNSPTTDGPSFGLLVGVSPFSPRLWWFCSPALTHRLIPD